MRNSVKIKQKCRVTVVEDFPEIIIQKRRILEPIARAANNPANNENLVAKVVVDKILINKKLYSVDNLNTDSKSIQPCNVFTPKRGNLTAFFTSNSPLSNHYPCKINIHGKEYSCSEQFYLESKALKFGDLETAAKIMKEGNPVQMKQISRNIKPFDHNIWADAKQDMRTALKCKFQQNASLKTFLLNTANTRLIEASPNDKYCGMSLWNPKLWETKSWASTGKNIMGTLWKKYVEVFQIYDIMNKITFNMG
jgi:ribA/ribD-fused uncharacterized protein